jgi:glycosyltransferase 2 family protein
MKRTSRPAIRIAAVAVKVAISGGLLAYLFSRTDVSALLLRLGGMDPAWMIAALTLYGFVIILSAWRWKVLLGTQSVRVPTTRLSASFLVATFFNNFLPSNIGGDVIRVADSAPCTGSKTVATTVILADRGVGLLALFLVAAFGSLVAAWYGAPVPGAGYLWIVLGIAVGCSAPIVASPTFVTRMLGPLCAVRPEWVEERIGRLSGALEGMRRCPQALLAAFAGAIGVQLILVCFHLCVAWGLAIPLSFSVAVVIVPLSLAAQMLPISINGFGVREAVFTYFFTRFGLEIESALALSLVSVGLIMLFSISGGVLFLIRRNLPLVAADNTQ